MFFILSALSEMLVTILPTSVTEADVSSVLAAFSSAIAVRLCTTSTTLILRSEERRVGKEC